MSNKTSISGRAIYLQSHIEVFCFVSMRIYNICDFINVSNLCIEVFGTYRIGIDITCAPDMRTYIRNVVVVVVVVKHMCVTHKFLALTILRQNKYHRRVYFTYQYCE